MEQPKVAILSAMETINPKVPSTIEAAALCKMAERGQITGGILDGPLAFDNAISKEAARIKGITSEVAGDPDILLAPDLEAGNMLAKQLSFLANADSAGLVLGARVPIILTSRADTVRSKIASCAVAVIAAHARRQARVATSVRAATGAARWTISPSSSTPDRRASSSASTGGSRTAIRGASKRADRSTASARRRGSPSRATRASA
jgi:hypothetical protein